MIAAAALAIALQLGSLRTASGGLSEIPVPQEPPSLRGAVPEELSSVVEGPWQQLWDMEPPPEAAAEEEAGHYYQWMWADAGKNFLGHDLAELDPMRWSDWLTDASMIKDLKSYNNSWNMNRPVELRMAEEQPGMMPFPHRFPNITATVEFIQGKAGSEKPPGKSGNEKPPAKSGFEWKSAMLGAGAAVALPPLLCIAFLCVRSIRKVSQKSVREPEETSASESEDDTLLQARAASGSKQANAAQAMRGAWEASELKQLLQRVEQEESSLAHLGQQAQQPIGPAEPSQKEQALREVERILKARDPKSIFGSGTPLERRAEFRRLVRLLHPDKGHVKGGRAGLALRRVVENQP